MEISERQEKLLDFLIKEYITTGDAVSSKALQKVTDLDVCGATIRNDLQALTKEGYIDQPHTSAGRVPTKKAYKHFADKMDSERETTFSTFIYQEIRITKVQIQEELKLTEELMQTLENDNLFEILNILDTWHKKNRI